MGTVVTITIIHPQPGGARSMVSAAFAEMERLEGLFSRHRADTPLARLNATGSLSDAPRELVQVLEEAGRYSRISRGAFDVTVLPLLDLYGRSFRRSSRPPSSSDVQVALELVDYRGVQVDGRTVELADPRMSITLDGIAKGFIVDRTIDVLSAAGADRVLVNAGGDMATSGEGSRADPWLVSVQDPRNAAEYVDLIQLAGESIATSGDYMRTFTDDGRFHHIVDPRSGYSPSETSSATVVAATAMEADALSTTALVLGPSRGIALLEATEGAEGIVLSKAGETLRTSGMAGHAATA